jgi:8-oxo-dGTP pyrophosphatase MutT (NUDIX family)
MQSRGSKMETRNVAIIVLHDAKKKILLQQRSNDAERYPGYWGFFGGGIEGRETPEEAVRRECLEELCYQLENPLLVMRHKFSDKAYSGVKYVFIEPYDARKKLVQKEGQGLRWVGIHEINWLKTVEHDKDVYDFLRLILPSL